MSSVPPAARCEACQFSWNSPAMVEGLRRIGSCPKCGSATLVFRDDPPTPSTPTTSTPTAPPAPPVGTGDKRAPHLVLGIPRR